MFCCWIGAAFAAGTTPDDRVEAWSDVGIMTGQVGLAFGFGAGVHEGPVTVLGTAGFGGRGDLFETGASRRPSFALATLSAAIDIDKAKTLSIVALLDTALLDNVEQDCGTPTRSSCRHYLFVGMQRSPALGLSLQPAVGVRFVGSGASGSPFAATFALQPHWLRDRHLWYAPRVDFTVGQSDWSAHMWGGRYGLALGVGYRLSRPR